MTPGLGGSSHLTRANHLLLKRTGENKPKEDYFLSEKGEQKNPLKSSNKKNLLVGSF